MVRNSLSKRMCLRMCPQLSEVVHVTEPTSSEKTVAEVGPSNSSEWENLEKEHRIYAYLAHCCTRSDVRVCVNEAISASSTDNYPEESIHNTLESRDRVGRLASYWSSKGNKNPSAPERLIYKLAGDLCIITEIGIQPFQAYFQSGLPIYSADFVRFRLGHPKGSMDTSDYQMDRADNETAHEKFTWTYTSPEFPMAQENCLQKFKLAEPVLCIGGMLLVELLGRVQRQEMDGLFYICVTHVQVWGRPLSPAFGVEILEPEGKFALKVQKYDPKCLEETSAVATTALQRRVLYLGRIFHMLRGHVVEVDYDWDENQDEEQDESDDEVLLG
ncbi:F-box protein At4g00755 isoform X2 [Punica granatum]|uniref:F-box protein At4g00755 isoform X2 n=1 Tax=Punica granatum TaxID=22663 RepID=A0A6P8E486_PUNGR|nr:F-box protein At4g00755 isoform X2 [Punica granatum]